MKIEIFGKGCPKCQKTEENARKAVQESGIDAEVVHIYDEVEMLKRGIIDNPALVIDGELKIGGRVPEIEEIKKLLTES
ncbi:thioredoxin family protein [candidate division WOR-3 bacterium 4484_100]|uniref:Thioredoxin family protein n=1 Tax=candidate division WOR-3 bacterium 4484_100 TaxID=1936077 RepID=A0A1V4QFZ8_UNCW3|nr:MAG: thioredoxin family protein [candidate division WOR-3 bacterium 4484_100]